MNLKAFPFFDTLQEMKQACRHGVYLNAPVSRFLPFQIVKAHDGQPIDCINIYHASNDQLYRTIMGNEIAYDYHQTALQDFITYYGATISEPLDCGDYYLEISGRYSAIFSTVQAISGLLQVEWSNTSNLIDATGKPLVVYQTGLLQRVYLGAEVTSPAYPYQETGNENAYKEFEADFKRVVKQSQFETLKLPEYLVDALGALPLHDQVHVGAYRDVKEVEVAPSWLDLGTGASVKVTFSEATPVIAMGCGELLELEQYDVAGYTPRGFLCGIADANAYWEATGNTGCEVVNGQNTGYTSIEQKDINPASATYNQVRSVRGAYNDSLCGVPVTYWNTEQSEWVQRNNCAEGYTGTEVLVKVAANLYSSTISQTDANNKALAQLNSIKQGYANANGSCELAAIYQFVGNVTERYDTMMQACNAVDYTVGVYSSDGTYTALDGLYVAANGVGGQLANGYYRRASDGKVLDIWAGGINGISSCGTGEEEEF